MKNFLVRTCSGFIYALLIIGSIAAGPVYFGILVFVFLMLALVELYKISFAEGFRINRVLFIAPAVILYLLIFYWSFNQQFYLTPGLFGLFHLLLVFQLFSRDKPLIFNRPGFAVLPIVYVAIPLALLNYLYYLPAGMNKEIVVGYFIIIWLNDTFAYLTGKLFGRHKMFESVSPNKTWEGSLGGFVFGLAGAYLISLVATNMDLFQWLGLAFVTIVLGTFGDLFESLLKRRANLKDSGKIIPGHGGLLDRLDSILISSPFVFLYMYFIG